MSGPYAIGDLRRLQRLIEERRRERSRSGSRDRRISSESRDSSSLPIIPTVLKISFYLSILSLLGFIILIVMQYLGFPIFSFTAGSGGVVPIIVPTNRQNIYKASPIPVDASANFINLLPYKYTISFDTVIKSDFITQSVPRILLYRSQGSIKFLSSDTLDIIDNRLTFSNILVYLDPIKNDLYVRVYTGPPTYTPTADGTPPADSTSGGGTGGTGGTGVPGTVVLGPAGSSCVANAPEGFQDTSTRSSITSTAIQNVPIKTPFRVTIMITDVLLEVYLNGLLQQSVPLKLPPTMSDQYSPFYGPPALSRQSVSVSNISYWNTVLTSRAIRVYGNEPFASNGS